MLCDTALSLWELPFKRLLMWSPRLCVCRIEDLDFHRTVLEISGWVPVEIFIIASPLHSILQLPVSQLGD